MLRKKNTIRHWPQNRRQTPPALILEFARRCGSRRTHAPAGHGDSSNRYLPFPSASISCLCRHQQSIALLWSHRPSKTLPRPCQHRQIHATFKEPRRNSAKAGDPQLRQSSRKVPEVGGEIFSKQCTNLICFSATGRFRILAAQNHSATGAILGFVAALRRAPSKFSDQLGAC